MIGASVWKTGGNAIVEPERIQHLNNAPILKRRHVLYWMQASQRAEYNHALEYAIDQANSLHLPLIVAFGITETFPEANLRHYSFMLEGLHETQQTLRKRGILMIIRRQSPEAAAIELARQASLVVTDRGYLRVERDWRAAVARAIDCRITQVESNVVVPVETASDHEEYGARTIRPRIHRRLDQFLKPIRHRRPTVSSLDLRLDSLDISDPAATAAALRIDRSVPPAPLYRGGTSEARKQLRAFIRRKLSRYQTDRNDPNADALSNMSPYLHFGQISPLYVALQVAETGGDGADAYLEELIVRRELSMNFVWYNSGYDTFGCLPEWARRELARHADDARQFKYSLDEWERADTHDPYWNAAQAEMVRTGKMHGYMRMYWGKKILEWTSTPEEAFRIALYLNNKYEIDGRDPNGFANVAWCFGKFDRAWSSRPVFGKVRYMNAAGLRRKFDADAYAGRFENAGQTRS